MESLDAAAAFTEPSGTDTHWVEHLRSDDLSVGTYSIRGGGVDLELPSGARSYDGVVLACPATVSTRILGEHIADVLPWLGEVRYSPEVRVYAARPAEADAALGLHLSPPTPVFSVGTARPLPLLRLGLGVASHGSPLTLREVSRLKVLRLSHLRIDLRLARPG